MITKSLSFQKNMNLCLKFFTLVFLIHNFNSSQAKERCFPPDFKFGVGTSAYQIEGAWNEDGKGENIWDHFTHYSRHKILDRSDGNISVDSYHLYARDVEALKKLGAQIYRFSISWARILPTGDISKINPAGIQYYNNLIDELLKNGIEPFVTIFHWDLPQTLQEIGGWPNPILVEYFGSFSRLVFGQFGDRVKYWMTFNEPNFICTGGYGLGMMAPGVTNSGVDDYLCAHTIIKAHAKAYHIYHDEFKSKQRGKVGFTIVSEWYEPASDSEDDKKAHERALTFNVLWFAYPLLHGRYPKMMVDTIARKSAIQGFNKSRLPEFTKRESKYIKRTFDFGAINHYRASFVKFKEDSDSKKPSFRNDLSVDEKMCETCAWGLRSLLKWLVTLTKHPPEIIITENGAGSFAKFFDFTRINYHKKYITSLLDAIEKDKINVTGYVAWTLMDSFEWMFGYKRKMGFYYVDGNDPERKRIPKLSFYYIRKIFTTKCIDD